MSSSRQSYSSPFVPSPQYLSKSPARAPSSTTSGTPRLRRTPRGSPGRFQGLVSPIPPPPPNLHPEPEESFSVDPGLPFLATEGDSERTTEREGSQKDQRFVGGFVSGIRDSVRRSLRRRRRYPREPGIIDQGDQSDIQDSGYSSALTSAPHVRRPSTAEAVISHEGPLLIQAPPPGPIYHIQPYPRPPRTKHLVSHEGYPVGYDPILALDRFSDNSETRTSTDFPLAPDYVDMGPLPSDVTFRTYIRRLKRFVHHIASLPFSNRYRVTYDHYPEHDLRDNPRRLPVIVWQRPDFRESPPRGQEETNLEPSVIPTTGSQIVIKPVPATVIQSEVPPPVFQSTPSRRQTPQHPSPIHPAAFNTPSFVQPAPIGTPSGWQPPTGDPTWFEALNVPRPPSTKPSVRSTTKRWRAATPYHAPVPIRSETPRPEWETYPHYRRGYVPAEFAETHYGTRYGAGIHSARAGLAPLDGHFSSTSTRPAISPR